MAPSTDQTVATNLESLIEPEQYDSDDVSSLGSDSESITTSLKSSVYNYKIENGRRYSALDGGKYFLPNDENELDRLDLYHHVVTMRTDNKLHLAPIGPHPERILDIGTGTGIWAIEMGDLYPKTEILGNDLSPVQPSLVPPNVRFEVDNVEEDWTYHNQFDYIHCRYMAGSIKNWPRLMEQAFKFTKPGGWVEFQDFTMRWYTHTGTFQPGCPLDTWCSEIIDGIKSIGLDPEPGPSLKGWVEDAGFVNLTHRILPIPTGTWPKDRRMKEIGMLDLTQFLEGLEALSMRSLIMLRGYTKEEVEVLLGKLRVDLTDQKRMQAQHNMHVVYAQKPYEAGTEPTA